MTTMAGIRRELQACERDLSRQLSGVREAIACCTPETTASALHPRRVRVEGLTGVYEYRNSIGGRHYEITWTEKGKKRWQVCGCSLEDAVAARDAKIA